MKSFSRLHISPRSILSVHPIRFRRLLAVAAVVSLAGAAFAWDPPVPVDVNTTTAIRSDTVLSAAAGAGSARGVVWSSDGHTTDNLNGVFFSRSANGGASWSPAVDLINTAVLPLGSWGEHPAIATDAGNTWIIGWDACTVSGKSIQVDRDIYFKRSTDGGLNWSPTAILNANAADVKIRNYTVNFATDKSGTWCATWATNHHFQSFTNYSPISVSRSTDNTQTWPAVQLLDEASSNTSNQNPHIATNGSGVWIVAWDSSNTTDTDIRYCRSLDNGNTWSAGNWLNTTAVSDNVVPLNHDGQVRLAAGSGGLWVAVWSSSVDFATMSATKDRIVYSRSLDNGATWSPPAAVDTAVVANAPVEITPDIVWTGTHFALLWSGPSGIEASNSADGVGWAEPVAVTTSNLKGGPESRPRIATGGSGLRLGAWVRRPAGASGPDIISATDASGANATNWNLWW